MSPLYSIRIYFFRFVWKWVNSSNSIIKCEYSNKVVINCIHRTQRSRIAFRYCNTGFTACIFCNAAFYSYPCVVKPNGDAWYTNTNEYAADSAAYLPWCYTIFSFEHPVEIRQIWESTFLWDFKNRIIGRCEHCTCFCDTEVIHIWDKAHSGMDLKKFHKMRWTIVAKFCNFFDGYIFIIMCGDIPDDTFQFLFMLITLRSLVYFWRVRNQ